MNRSDRSEFLLEVDKRMSDGGEITGNKPSRGGGQPNTIYTWCALSLFFEKLAHLFRVQQNVFCRHTYVYNEYDYTFTKERRNDK